MHKGTPVSASGSSARAYLPSARIDSDCDKGALCSWSGSISAFACQSPLDRCGGDADCGSNQACEVRALPSDFQQHARSCEGRISD